MKKVLCYIALVLLVALIILPPALRIFVNEDIVPSTKDVVELLNCTKINEIVSMSYVNSEISNIKYTIPTVSGDIYDPLFNENSIKQALDKIKNIDKSVKGDKTVYVLDLTNNLNSNQLPNRFRQSIQEQKVFYEGLSFTCNIIKS